MRLLAKHLEAELKAMYESPISNLVDEVNLRLVPRGENAVQAKDIVQEITRGGLNSSTAIAFHTSLAFWDNNEDSKFRAQSGSHERRAEVLRELGLMEFADEINDSFPVTGARHYVISDVQKWEKWYSPNRGNKFYWLHYKKTLLRKGYDQNGIEQLSASIDDVMRGLPDPSAESPYQSKGLVIGHVQSGKTSHFTGLIAKAISSGYKLIIVLTGTIEMLRAQTQRRLDMELVGKENILNGRSEQDYELLSDVDYVLNDAEWEKFVKFNYNLVADPSVPQIIRLTTYKSDFKALKQGLDALDFQKDRKRSGMPIFHSENLEKMPVRLLVLKKNSTTLKKVIMDLKSIHTNLQEVPALIIDDEADQASPNTKAQSKRLPADSSNSEEEVLKKERTAINGHISTFLKLMPRAQYVGYTATPFANVFIEPDDSEDIFPKDFIIPLVPSDQYLGAKHFHDLDSDPNLDTSDMSVSNEAAFVRAVTASTTDEEVSEISRALDAFVLTGAIKLFRRGRGVLGDFRHHTMLVHTSAFKEQHREMKRLVDRAWDEAGYSHPDGLERLWSLLESDFRKLNLARGWDDALPSSKDELSEALGQALSLFNRDASPVVVVNSDADLESRQLNFKESDEWRVIIGGAKLSRGFTVEGLTISYFRRKSTTQDALMQMGRWFGYRPGYRDLVRLFIGRNEETAKSEIDLYDAFTSVVRDEEEFRDKLKQYSERSVVDDSPLLKPSEIPPLVFQTLTWLRPTSRNKMFNAVLTEEGYSQKFIEKARHLPYDPETYRHNFGLFEDLILPSLVKTGRFSDGAGGFFEGIYGIVPASNIVEFTEAFKYSGDALKPTASFIRTSAQEGTITDFFVLIRKNPSVPFRAVRGGTVPLPLIRRRRRTDGSSSLVGTEPKSRPPLMVISGKDPGLQDDLARSLKRETRASLLIELVLDQQFQEISEYIDPSQVIPLFGFVFPFKSAPNRGRLAFQALQRGGPAIIDSMGSSHAT
jgi:hypothetical protein